jgi:hypothetical protein
MVIVTAFAIGLLSASLRSAVYCALAGCLIVAVFTLAAMVSSGTVSILALALALLSYNVGIAVMLLMAFVRAPRHQA